MNTEYIPQQGLLAASNSGSQKVTSLANGVFTFRSSILATNVTSRVTIDSCWESGNTFRVNDNEVIKETFAGTMLYANTFTSPSSLSVLQERVNIPINRTLWGEERGCWITDSTEQKLYLVSNTFGLVGTVSGFNNPVLVVSSDFDKGCFVFDDGVQRDIKVSNAFAETGYHTYAALSPGGSGAFPTSTLLLDNATVDGEGNLWFLYNNILSKLSYDNETYATQTLIYPLTDLGLSSSYYAATSFDVARGLDNHVFVCGGGGCSDDGWLAEYDNAGILIRYEVNINMCYPLLLKVGQMSDSAALYVIVEEDPNEIPFECGSESSESSSSSTSSSSSSLTTGI